MIEFSNALGWFSGSCVVLALILSLFKAKRKNKDQDPPNYINSIPFITVSDCELLIVLAVLFVFGYFMDKYIIQKGEE
jgi:hypothetical protein